MKIAIVGSSPSAGKVRDTPADEVWTMNHMHYAWTKGEKKFDFPRMDLLLEIHKDSMIKEAWLKEQQKGYMSYLHQEHDFPIYMQEVRKDVPSSVRYPIEEVKALVPGSVFVGDEETEDIFGSSLDYLVGLAVLRKASDIYFYGCRFGRDEEYKYQAPLSHVWMGICLSNGIVLHFLPRDNFFEQKDYGYNAWVRIHTKRMRKDLRKLKTIFSKSTGEEQILYSGMIQQLEWLITQADAQSTYGREALGFMKEDMGNQLAGHIALHNKEQEAGKPLHELQRSYRNVLLAEGAWLLLDKYIDVCELKDMDYTIHRRKVK